MLALASQFDKDALQSLPIEVRCGFEAEFASSEPRPEVAERLATILDIPAGSINVSNRHGASHGGGYTNWSVEADGSVPTDTEHPVQIEIVSPVLDYNEMLESMESVFEIIKDIGLTSQGADVGSNDSTGLHITFSSDDLDLNSIDPLKLVLLLGEHYYAQMFGRENSGYAASVVQSISDSVGSGQLTTDDIREYIDDPTMGNLHDIVWTSLKRTLSVNFTKSRRNSGVIEFRLPGGKGYEHKFSKIAAVAKRFVHAMYAACSPDLYKEIYAKKLFKMVSTSQEAVVKQREPELLGDDAVIKSRVDSDGRTELYTVLRTAAGVQRTELASLVINNGAIQDFSFGLNLTLATANQVVAKLRSGSVEGIPALDAITLMHMFAVATDTEKPLQHRSSITNGVDSQFRPLFEAADTLDAVLDVYYSIASSALSRYPSDTALNLLKYVLLAYVGSAVNKSPVPTTATKDDRYISYVIPAAALIPDGQYRKVFGVGKFNPSSSNILSLLDDMFDGRHVDRNINTGIVLALYLKAGRNDLIAKLLVHIPRGISIADVDASIFKAVRADDFVRPGMASLALIQLAEVKKKPRSVLAQYIHKARPVDIKRVTQTLVECYLEEQDGAGYTWTPDTGVPYIDKAFVAAFSSALAVARTKVAEEGIGDMFLRNQFLTITDYACIEAMTEKDLENYVKHGSELNRLVGEICRSFRDTPMPKSDVVYDFALFCSTNIIKGLVPFNGSNHNGSPTLGRDLSTWYNDLYKDPVRLALIPEFKKIEIFKLFGFFSRNLPPSAFYNDNLYAFLSTAGRGSITLRDSLVFLGIVTDNGEKAVPEELLTNPAFLYALSGFEENKILVIPSALASTLPSDIQERYNGKKLHPTVLALRLGKKKKLEAAKQGEG